MPSARLAERPIATRHQHSVGFRCGPELACNGMPALIKQTAKIIRREYASMEKIAQPVLGLGQEIRGLLSQSFRN